ncbi:elongation factor P [Qipengyuania mesophila]|uniref:elongation factor P n=1 Tax=Qipengyuania mesophila TaxID=2867246 RepID=UPI003516F856
MIDLKKLTLLAALAGLASPPAMAQGRLSLLAQGEYICALPGDATGAAWIVQEGREFAVTGGSSYRTEQGSGSYLMEGKLVTFTRGPMRGAKFMLLGSGLLQQVGRDGKLGRMRCHRAGPVED